MSPKLRKHHKTDRKLIKSIIPNTSKTCYTNSIYGFMRQVQLRNNPNKETLIYIPLSHVTVIRVDTTGVAKNYEFNKSNYGKTSCTNTVYGFMRLVRWRNNPNNETLIYILYTSRHRILSLYDLSCLLNCENIIKSIENR